jgi:agmatine deiminase
VNAETPSECGYRWPAEWEAHEATWIAWPHNHDTWPGHFEGIPEIFAALIRAITRFEPVHILAGGQRVMQQAKAMVGDLPEVTLHDIPTNDAWIRDYGPTFLGNRHTSLITAVHWEFDSWGGKYPPWDLDNAAATRMAEIMKWRSFDGPAVLEGGAIDGNGQGVVLTTESCLLDVRRNAVITRRDMERILSDYLGAERVVWLPGGAIAGDDTDGHIDQLARFVGPQHLVVATEENEEDENYAPLAENLARLTKIRELSWPELDVTRLPMPKPVYFEQQRVPASYCNFYIVNGGVIVPQFDDAADHQALETLTRVFPRREVVGLPARQLVWGLGAYHCLAQQQPRATS